MFAELQNQSPLLTMLISNRRLIFRDCYLIVIAAVSLATFVASLMVFLLESALQEGVSLH